jgi:tetratricopeptide (TPR) repeat protein
MSVSALTQVAGIARSKEEFSKAIDYYQRTLNISPENGEVWGSLGMSAVHFLVEARARRICRKLIVIMILGQPGHCYLMTDDLQKAYTAYQQALYRLPNPKVSCEAQLD